MWDVVLSNFLKLGGSASEDAGWMWTLENFCKVGGCVNESPNMWGILIESFLAIGLRSGDFARTALGSMLAYLDINWGAVFVLLKAGGKSNF